jgi:hypothetical protein
VYLRVRWGHGINRDPPNGAASLACAEGVSDRKSRGALVRSPDPTLNRGYQQAG